MPNSQRRDGYTGIVIAATVIALVCIIAAVFLAVDDNRESNGAIVMALVGFVGTVVGAFALILRQITSTQDEIRENSTRLMELDATVKNGGLETPIKRALHSSEGQTAIKTAVSEVVRNTKE